MTETGKSGESISRRGLLKRFLPEKLEEPVKGYFNETLLSRNDFKLTRRGAIKFITGFGVVMALELERLKDAGAYEERKKLTDKKSPIYPEPEQVPPPIENKTHLKRQGLGVLLAAVGGPVLNKGANQIAEALVHKMQISKGSYKETLVQASLQLGADILAEQILKSLSIEHGNKGLESDYGQHLFANKPELLFSLVAIQAPLFEEAMFRLIPSEIAAMRKANNPKDAKSDLWKVGIPTSVIFALIHNISPEEPTNLRNLESVPVAQFMGGLFLWKMMREKGFNHVAFAHSYGNTVAFGIAKLLYKAYPKAG